MADPLSIVASAITVAATAANISKGLFTIAETLKNAPREIADIAEDISIQSQSLVTLAEVIEAHKSLCKPDLYKQIDVILRRFKQVEEELKKLTCSRKKLERLQWFFRKPKAKALLCKIEVIKNSLILELNIVRLAADEVKRS
jgi:DNA repair ATPase RecN